MAGKIRCPNEAENHKKATQALEEAIIQERAFYDEIFDWESGSWRSQFFEDPSLRRQYAQKARDLEALIEQRSKERLDAFLGWVACEELKV